MDKDREEREHILIKIKKLRRMLRNATDPGAARAIDGVLRNAEARLAGLLGKGSRELAGVSDDHAAGAD